MQLPAGEGGGPLKNAAQGRRHDTRGIVGQGDINERNDANKALIAIDDVLRGYEDGYPTAAGS